MQQCWNVPYASTTKVALTPLLTSEFFSFTFVIQLAPIMSQAVSRYLHHRGQFDSKFQVEVSPPPIIFAGIVRPMNALQLCR